MSQAYRLSPVHHWHEQHGAQFILWVGWKQVDSYGDPSDEARVASCGVGLCDMTPLTKIDIQGKQSDELLTRFLSTEALPPLGLHSHAHPSGDQTRNIRVIHLTHDRYLVLGLPEVRDSLYENLSLAALNLGCVHVTDITSGLAVIRILGPKSVEVLNRLCPVGLASPEFSSGRCIQAPIARVNTTLLRNDISGLVSIDALISRDYGEYVWKSLKEAGQPFKISWFGLAAGRYLGGKEMQSVAVV